MGGVALAVVRPEVYGHYGRVNGGLQEGLHQGGPSRTAAASVPVPAMSPCCLRPPQVTLPTVAGSFGSVFYRVTALFLWVLVCARFCLCIPRLESLFPLLLLLLLRDFSRVQLCVTP